MANEPGGNTLEAEENAEGAARIWMRHGADKMGGEEVIDEAFIDVLCDLIYYGGG